MLPKPDIEDKFFLKHPRLYRKLWDDFATTDIVRKNIVKIEIGGAIAEKFRGNFYGLLMDELKIPMEAHYINMIINNIKGSFEYNGKRTLYILKAEKFQLIYDLIRTVINKESNKNVKISKIAL